MFLRLFLRNLLLSVLAVAFGASCAAQIPFFGTRVMNSAGAPLASGTMVITPRNNSNQPEAFHVGAGGTVTAAPVFVPITNGAFSTTLPDTFMTGPINVCFRLSVQDPNTYAEDLPGYTCVQPSLQGNSPAVIAGWCNPTSGCNLDLYVSPVIPGIAQTTGPTGITGAQGASGCLLGTNCQTISFNNIGGVLGATGNGVTDDSGPLTAACSQYADIWITAPLGVNSSPTLSCDVHFIDSGAINPSSGNTVTMRGRVYSGPQKRFGGVGLILFDKNQQTVDAEWMGAVGDGTTNDYNAIQGALNACTLGLCDVTLQDKSYSIGGGTLTLPPDTGLVGPPVANLVTGNMARILSTSPAADIVDLGAKGNTSYTTGPGQRLKRLMAGRTVLPAAGSRGVACNGVMGTHMEQVTSSDSYSDFYFNGCPSGQDTFGDQNNIATWQLNGAGGYPTGAALSGYEYDSENGLAMNSHFSRGDQVAGSAQPAGTSATGLYVHGVHINDINVADFSTAAINYGERIIYDGPAGVIGQAFDLHHTQNVHDQCLVACISISNVPGGPTGGIDYEDLYAIASSANSQAITILNSSGIKINGSEIGNVNHGSSLLLQNSSNNQFSNFRINVNQGGAALYLLNSSNNSFVNGSIINSIQGSTIVAVLGLPFGATTGTPGRSMGNTFANIHLDGIAQTAWYFDQYAGLNWMSNISTAAGMGGYSDNSVEKQLISSCPYAGVPNLVKGPAAGSDATVAYHAQASNESLPQNNCSFAVTYTPGSAATGVGSLFGALFTQRDYGTGIATQVNMSGVVCRVVPVGAIAAASLPYNASSYAEAVVAVTNAPTGPAEYQVNCTP